MARKRKSKPTRRKRSYKQEVRDRYAHAREDAQLLGLIPTLPEEALKAERVSPSLQGEQPLPGLIGKAIRQGWAVPEEKKPKLVDELIEIVENPEVDTVPKVMAYNALTKGDLIQYERDHPEEAAKAKGKTEVNVGIGFNWDALITEMQQPVVDTIEEKVAAVLSSPLPENNGQDTTKEKQQ